MLISFLFFCDIILDFKNQYPGVNMDIIEIGDDAIVEFPWTISIIIKKHKYITKAMQALLTLQKNFLTLQ